MIGAAARRDVLRTEPEVRAKLERISMLGADSRASGASVSPETPTSCDASAAETLFARIAWARLTEPGDGIAGAMITALGAAEALAMLIVGTSAREVRAAMSAHGVDVPEKTIGAAMSRWRPRLDRDATLGDIDRALEGRMTVLIPEDEEWPAPLGDLGVHAPVSLWLRGDPRLLRAPSLSVVGARAATGYGTHLTAEIVEGVCRQGLSIVSGAAYGIDAIAHRTALSAEAPTIAVLAGGADRHYPVAHDSLLERIAHDGLVCAEMIPGAAPTRWRFRQRNRIIAALSPATLVTEAGVRSGTLNTAGHAAQMGRNLGAVPGPVTSAASAGCHRLIREYGAALVTNSAEVLELLGIDDRLDRFQDRGVSDGTRIPPDHERVLDALPLRGRRTFAEIVNRSGVGAGETRGVLAELELLERVKRHETPGDPEPKWSLVRAQ